jgi:hypothetical protein
MQGFPGLLGSTGRLVKLMRRCYGGQEGQGATNGEESRWQSNSLAAVLGAILALHGLGSRVASLGSFLVARRSYCRGWQGRRCSGAAGPWWRRELCAAEQGGDGTRVWWWPRDRG